MRYIVAENFSAGARLPCDVVAHPVWRVRVRGEPLYTTVSNVSGRNAGAKSGRALLLCVDALHRSGRKLLHTKPWHSGLTRLVALRRPTPTLIARSVYNWLLPKSCSCCATLTPVRPPPPPTSAVGCCNRGPGRKALPSPLGLGPGLPPPGSALACRRSG